MDGGSPGSRLGWLVLFVAGPALLACGGDPGGAFAQLEEELLQRPELRVSFHITSQGAFAASSEDAQGTRGIRFEIWVAGQPAGEATLWLGEGGLPVSREQVVRFPGGEMRVVERYEVQ